MEDEIQLQAQACKFPRLENGTRNESNNKMGSSVREQYPPPDEKEDGGELRRRNGVGSTTNHNFQSSAWHHHSSRIIRVSRASGGKDRHSKVMTSKGLRDRRVRLSVTTAIQFYDLQDRLGYDQPSKAVEWLIKAASDAISELPSLNNTFPETPNQQQPSPSITEKRPSDDQQNQSQNLSLSKSACSSNSETSKGSGLSLSRSEIRVKARERARERASKEKENESNIHHNVNHHNHNNQMSQTASFTELLTGGIGSSTATVPTTTTTSPYSTVTPMDYFSSGLLVGHSSSRTHQSSSASAASASSSSGFSGQIQLGHSNSHCLQVSPFSGENENHSDHQMQHFPFMNEHLMPPHHVVTCSNSCSQPSGSDYNLNFTISSGLAGYDRGTLQSNSPSLLPHLQRFSTMDGSSTTSNNLPFFIGAAAAAPPTMDNHHHLQFSPVFDGRLQLCYGDGSRHSDQKAKSNKN